MRKQCYLFTSTHFFADICPILYAQQSTCIRQSQLLLYALHSSSPRLTPFQERLVQLRPQLKRRSAMLVTRATI